MNDLRIIEQKISSLPPGLMFDLEIYIDFLLQKFQSPTSGKLKQKWAGALKEYRSKYTSIVLQKKSLDWRV